MGQPWKDRNVARETEGEKVFPVWQQRSITRMKQASADRLPECEPLSPKMAGLEKGLFLGICSGERTAIHSPRTEEEEPHGHDG